LDDIQIVNFKTKDGATACSGNKVFKQLGGANDITNALAASNTVFTNSDLNQIFNFQDPNKNLIGWQRGCGLIVCT